MTTSRPNRDSNRRDTAPPMLNTGTLELTSDECRRLLLTQEYGRIGLVIDGRPAIFPVNFALDHDGAVVFRTAAGMKLAAAVNHPVVFEVDSVDRTEHRGWSVIVHGVAHHTADVWDGARRLAPWLPSRPYLIRIDQLSVSGRAVGGRPAELVVPGAG